jgi:hypothetical protein
MYPTSSAGLIAQVVQLGGAAGAGLANSCSDVLAAASSMDTHAGKFATVIARSSVSVSWFRRRWEARTPLPE